MRESDFPFFDDERDDQPVGRRAIATDGATTADPEADPSPTRPRTSKTRRALLIALAAVLVVVLAIGGVIGYYFSRVDSALNKVSQGDLMPAPYEGRPEVTKTPGVNIMLVGADKNDNGSDGRSDVLIIAHISGDRQSVYLVSFPRDLWVNVPANDIVKHDSMAKINAAYSWGRTPLAIKTVEQLTQVRIDHTAEINFGGFMGLTEHLGGVTVDNKVASSASSGQNSYSWPKGPITIQGDEALAFVRQRHGLPNGDLDRAERQRAVLVAIFNKAVQPEILGNPAKFGELIDVAAGSVTVDRTLPSSEVKGLVYGLKIRERSQIHSLQAPISGFGRSSDGQSIAVPDANGIAELSTALREDKMADYIAKHPS